MSQAIRRAALLCFAALAAAAVPDGPARAQHLADPLSCFAGASSVIVPQARSFALAPRTTGIEIESVDVHVEVLERAARTTIQMSLRNHSSVQDDAVVLLPVPAGSAVVSFAFDGYGAGPDMQVLAADEARRLYDAIVARVRDPALLEFAGYNLIRSSVFPVPPHGSRSLRLTYVQVLPADGDRVDYFLPRSESLERRRPWPIAVELKSTRPISAVYSPSHAIQTRNLAPDTVSVAVTGAAQREPGPFRLSWLLGSEGVSATLMACPDPEIGGGYFMLLAGLPPNFKSQYSPQREVTLVIDRSGSMAGAKWEQARSAALQVLSGLAAGDTFNIFDYGTTVASFAPCPVVLNDDTMEQARRYLESIRPSGGTNIHDALREALRQPPVTAGSLPIVLFLTDGLPTIGRTGEAEIREMVQRGNALGRRVFTVGIGYDVNAPLLDAIATVTRGNSTYVLPQEEIGDAVASVFRRMTGPVFADPVLETLDADGNLSTRLVGELIPRVLPDFFEGDQLVLLGQYRGHGPITFRLSGTYLGERRTFKSTFDLDRATTAHSFVSRLWASRRIAELADQVRQEGAIPSAADPRHELVDEIVRLSTRFGVLSEFTAFLATEGTDLSDLGSLWDGCATELRNKAIKPRSGHGAVSTSMNLTAGKGQSSLNYSNSYRDESFQPIEFANVQQIGDLAFFRRGEWWIDSRLLSRPGSLPPDEVITAESDRFQALLHRLTLEGRQAVLSLSGDILFKVDGRAVLIKGNGC